MAHTAARTLGRQARHRRIRKRVVGLTTRPRLCVYRSHKHLHVQVIDDIQGRTLLGRSTLTKAPKGTQGTNRGNVSSATALGAAVAEAAKQQGITRMVFDRSGYNYHGRIKALADALRAGGIEV